MELKLPSAGLFQVKSLLLPPNAGGRHLLFSAGKKVGKKPAAACSAFKVSAQAWPRVTALPDAEEG
ncbi:MAG: hypothetical protein V4721_00070 [Bacteroidota bacterium]